MTCCSPRTGFLTPPQAACGAVITGRIQRRQKQTEQVLKPSDPKAHRPDVGKAPGLPWCWGVSRRALRPGRNPFLIFCSARIPREGPTLRPTQAWVGLAVRREITEKCPAWEERPPPWAQAH